MDIERVPFYRSPRAYDERYGAHQADIAFWVSLAERLSARRVLELGCGTGRLTLPLARAGVEHGWQVVGLDLLPPMLAGAEAKLAAEPAALRQAVRLVLGDMRAFALGEQFDLIAIPFNTLGHLHTIDDQLACLRAARRHLAPGGHLAVDVVQPSVEEFARQALAPDETQLEGASIDQATGVRTLHYRRRRYCRATQTAETRYFAELLTATGETVVETGELQLHLFWPRELELLYRLAGLRVAAAYGDYAFGPFTDDALQLIIVGAGDET